MMHKNSLAPYLSPDEREIRVDSLSKQLNARVVEYGRSAEDRPLRAVCVSATSSQAPRVLCTANIHGPEFIAGMVALGFLEKLIQNNSGAALLRKRAEIWVIPCLNPDGYARTWRKKGQGRPAELRHNKNGVDLNRNFPLPSQSKRTWLPWRGSARPGKFTYRGPKPLSEPETSALDSLLHKIKPKASVNFHSFMGTILPPFLIDREQYQVYRSLCRQFKRAQPHVKYFRLSSRLLDGYTGELEDHQHHNLGCYAICVECMTIRKSFTQHLRAPSVFWRFNPHDPGFWIENDVPGMGAFFQAVLDLPTQSK